MPNGQFSHVVQEIRMIVKLEKLEVEVHTRMDGTEVEW